VPYPLNCFDEAGISGVLAQCSSDVGDTLHEGVVGNRRVVPEARDQFFLVNQLESSREQEQQNVKRLLTEGLFDAIAFHTTQLWVYVDALGSKDDRPQWRLPVVTRRGPF
jgi:hypothetical protein